ncbi:hypothetical protein UPYG_G00069710 [Umbra pygmaea]|uniref:RIIa domain-containing protein n=1 Tax=Umbra pygmaea TaxID=75934 RepID=A0ABD0XEI2_UMBPY
MLKANRGSVTTNMSHRRTVVNIPTGLEDLLEAVSMAVVKCQPDTIPVFAATFFNDLLIFRDEMPIMPINELVKEFSATKGCHFYKTNNEDIKQQPQDTVQGPEMFPGLKPILERGTRLLPRKRRCEDLKESFSLVPCDLPCRSRDIQSMDTAAATYKSKDQTEMGQQVIANPIVLAPGPILDIAKVMAVYRRRIDPNPSPRSSLSLSSSNLCAGIPSAIFELVSLRDINPELPAVLIRTGVLPLESLIVVKTEPVPDIIVFQADPLLAESAVVAAPPGASPLSAKSSCTSMLVALAAGPTLETIHPISDDTTAPFVETQEVVVSEPEECHAPKVTPVTPVKPLESTSVAVTTQEIPGSVPAVSPSPLELQGSVPANAVQEVQINLSKHSVQEVAGDSTGLQYPLPLATLETECVNVILPHLAAVNVGIQASTQACLPTTENVYPEPSSGICHSSIMVETKLDSAANLPGPAAVTWAKSSNVTCPNSGTNTVAPVPLCVPVVSSAPSVQIPPPIVVPPLREETLSSSAPAGPSTLMASGESRTPFLVYLPLPAPELLNNPGLLCQLGLGPEEAKSLPVLCLSMTSAHTPVMSNRVAACPATTADAAWSAAKDLPRSCVTNLPGVTDTPGKKINVIAETQDLPQTPCHVANTDGRQEQQRTQSNLLNTNGIQEPQRTDGYVANIPGGPHNPSCSAVCQDVCFHCPSGNACNISRNNVHSPAATALAGSMCCPFSVNPQEGAALSHGTQSPGYGTQSPGYGTQSPGYGTQSPGYGTQSPGQGTQSPGHCPSSLLQQACMAQNSHSLPTNIIAVCSPGHSPCGSISHSGSHWRFCHLTQPESQGRIPCPNQNSLTMMHCNSLERLADIPIYQDCVHCTSSCLLPCSPSSHSTLHSHCNAQPNYPAHNLGTSLVQPQTSSYDPRFYSLQQNRLVATHSQERQRAGSPFPLQ